MIGAMAALAAIAPSQMPGDLVITPTKVVLDDRTRSGDITLVNRGSQTVRYRLTLVEMAMSEDGVLRRVPSDSNSAAGVLRLSPREILLEPGISQRIKIAAFLPKDLPEHELRSHLAFEPIAIPKPQIRQQTDLTQTLKLNFELRSVVTIPIVVRHGRLAAEATITDASVFQDAGGWMAGFRLVRAGARSIRGDVAISFIPDRGGPRVQVGQIVGLPVYFPNADRIVTVRLTRDVRSLGKGEIEISFVEPERSRGAVTAKTVVKLPN